MSKGTIFFSYSRDDSKFVLLLAKELRKSGVTVWLDQLDIRRGEAWDDTIEAALRSSAIVLVVLSKSSVLSQNVKDEYSYAIDKGKNVIPVLLEECDVPFRLRRKQYADFSKDPRQGVKELVETLNLDDEVTVKLKTSKVAKIKKTKRKTPLRIIVVLFGLMALFWIYKLSVNTKSQGSSPLTVLVHDASAKDQLVLPNRGEVKLIYGDANVVETINSKGEATFKQIPASFFTEDASVEIMFNDPEGEPYRAVNPDSTYQLTKGTYIALAVKLYGLEAINGIVKNFESGDPVEGVRVSISGIETFTNKYGEYTLSIPASKQQKFQTVRASKEGYEPFELSDVPIQTDQEIPIVLKPKSP